MSTDEPDFDPIAHIEAYRQVMGAIDRAPVGPGRMDFEAIAERLRQEWAAWNGGDTHELHEIAFGG